MNFSEIHSALVQAWVTGDFGLETAHENRKFTPGNDPWAALFIVPNQPSAASLGPWGYDEHDGFLQVDLNYPLDQGAGDALAAADAVAQWFKPGIRFAYGNQIVQIRSCGRSQGRREDRWYRISLTIYWRAFVRRGEIADARLVELVELTQEDYDNLSPKHSDILYTVTD